MQALLKTSKLEYLGYSHFAMMCAFAFALHVMAAFGISMMPHIKIIDIPVHAMNIRLGDSDSEQQQMKDEQEEIMPQPQADNSELLESAMTKLIRKTPVEKPKPPAPKVKAQPPEKPDEQPQIVPKNDTPRQFVRYTPPDKTVSGLGSVLGNSTDSKAEVKVRYEQTISLWIQKFKLYPESARSQGMQGHTVVRIRIDRRGNIRYSALEGNTGYDELDRAALDMVRRANPVPAVPEGYPGESDMLEFLIPVNFAIK